MKNTQNSLRRILVSFMFIHTKWAFKIVTSIRWKSIYFHHFLLVLFMLFMNYHKRSKRAVPTVAELAINTLSKRMIYYPIVQVIYQRLLLLYMSSYVYTWYYYLLIDTAIHPYIYTNEMIRSAYRSQWLSLVRVPVWVWLQRE